MVSWHRSAKTANERYLLYGGMVKPSKVEAMDRKAPDADLLREMIGFPTDVQATTSAQNMMSRSTGV